MPKFSLIDRIFQAGSHVTFRIHLMQGYLSFIMDSWYKPLTAGIGLWTMDAYSVLAGGGGAEGVVDDIETDGEGALLGGDLSLFSASLRDMAMASCKSSSSWT